MNVIYFIVIIISIMSMLYFEAFFDVFNKIRRRFNGAFQKFKKA
jgi:hypothetical protein